MSFGFAGAAAGGQKALEDIVAERIAQQKLQEAIRERQQQFELDQARQTEATTQNAWTRSRADKIDADNAATKAAKAERDATQGRARSDMAGVLAMPGMSPQAKANEIMGSGLRTGLVDPKEAMSELAKATPAKLKYTYTDPKTGNKSLRLADPSAAEAGLDMGRDPVKPERTDNEPLVAIMGPDNLPVLVPRSQAVGKRPASTREQGRPVQVSSAKDMSDIDEALKLANQLDFKPSDTGVMPSLGAAAPDFVTNMTGFGVADKQRQGMVNLVKQIIGKGLEGGVLRKEDEAKYEKMLPTLSDHPDVVQTKIRNLKNTMEMKRSTLLDSLTDAGFDTSRFVDRGAPKQGGGKVKMQAPDGTVKEVDSAEVEHFKKLGAKVVGQ